MAERSVGADQAQLKIEAALALAGVVQFLHHQRPVVGVIEVDRAVEFGIESLGADAMDGVDHL